LISQREGFVREKAQKVKNDPSFKTKDIDADINKLTQQITTKQLAVKDKRGIS
jgi:hypothetical protein